MADITMCRGEDCKIKQQCYRYLATPSEYQSWFADKVNQKSNKCEYFWDYEQYTKSKLDA